MIRYRLDSQFHCSYLESRGVNKKREIISLSFPVHDFRWRHFRWCSFRWRHNRWCNFRWRHIWFCMRTRSLPVAFHSTPSNHKSMVPLYNLRDMSKEVCVSLVRLPGCWLIDDGTHPNPLLLFFCQSKRPLWILSRLVTFFLFFLFIFHFFFLQLYTTRITFTAMHDTVYILVRQLTW